MGVVSGKDLAIDGVRQVSVWKLQVPGDPAAWLASGNKGAYGRQAGIKDWRGMYSQFAVKPDYWPGDTFSMIASLDGEVGFTGDVMVDGIRVVWNQAKAEKIRVDTFFSSDGELTLGAAVAVDSTVPNPRGSVGKVICVGDAGDAVVDMIEDDVAQMDLYIFRRNPRYSGSSTPGYYKRTIGDLDVQVTWKRWTDTPSGLYKPFDIKEIRLYTSPWLAADLASGEFIEYYYVKWGVLDLLDDFGADHYSEDPAGATMRASFTGFKEGAEGELTYVSGDAGEQVEIWPPTV